MPAGYLRPDDLMNLGIGNVEKAAGWACARRDRSSWSCVCVNGQVYDANLSAFGVVARRPPSQLTAYSTPVQQGSVIYSPSTGQPLPANHSRFGATEPD